MNTRPQRHRPRARTVVQTDLDNLYAKLNISPLASLQEIKEVLNQQRASAMERRRARSRQQFGEEEDEMTRLQQIEEQIGTSKARARYEQANPQNELLTVQPSPHDRVFSRKYRAQLVSCWLIEELGRSTLLPTPDCARFWLPQGMDARLEQLLAEFQVQPAAPGAAEGSAVPQGSEAPACAPALPLLQQGPKTIQPFQ